jgi:hypothetical protein
MGPGPQGTRLPGERSAPSGDEDQSRIVWRARKAQLARMRVIAGGAPDALERLQQSEQDLDLIVRRWRNPDKVTDGNVESAESFTLKIYETLEDEIGPDPKLREAYVKVRRDVERLHDDAMDAISRFKLRQPESADELVTTRRAMIVAVRKFRELAGPLIAELELRSKRDDKQ